MRLTRDFIRKVIKNFILYIIILFPTSVWSITITADHLEYIRDEDKYIAIGNVRIEKDEAIITAEKIIFYQSTSDAEAIGNVVYEDPDTKITTERADVNLDTKTGKLHNAIIFFKKGNYWINGENIQKITENHYYASAATFTTCDTEQSEQPDWCFSGKDINIIIGRKLTARDVHYRIKGFPILYSPYLWIPIEKTERETGFLFPTFGLSTDRGFQFSPAFFWAIVDNMDATFYLDYFSKRGIGKGIEFRYIDFNSKGNWYIYHIRDRKLKKDFFEVKGFNEYITKKIGTYLEINYINEEEYYREYATRQDLRIQRFLQSSGEISVNLEKSRLYLIGQYWIDLKDNDKKPPQRLPEFGYFINPLNIGYFTFTMSSSITNFYREKETRGQRLDINPTLSYSFGDKIQFFQSLSLRETTYNLQNSSVGSSIHRETFEYRANAQMRFLKISEPYTHIIEPSLEYKFIPKTKSIPVFDSTENFNNTSIAQLSLLNIFTFKDFSVSARLTQPYDFIASKDSLLPIKLEASLIRQPIFFRFDTSYDIDNKRLETFNSEIGLRISDKTNMSIGERYNRENKLMFYKAEIETSLSPQWLLNANLWYDAKVKEIRDLNISATYKRQCWALNGIYSRKPSFNGRPTEHSLIIFVELMGLGRLKLL